VERIARDTALDIFDGLIIHTEPLPGRHLFAPVDQIAELRERGVLLALDAHKLSAPQQPPLARPEHEPPRDGRLHALLRRAWDRVNGR
jgi:hypothetical protein